MSQRGERPKAHGVAWGLRKTGGVMMRGRVELGISMDTIYSAYHTEG